MSRMILRPCQSLRGVHYNRIRCHARPLVHKSLVTALVRGYTAATPNQRPTAPLLAHSAILIPRSIKNTRPDDLVQRMIALPKQEIAANRFCVILVTPSFAPWLVADTTLGDDTFLAQSVRQIYQAYLKRNTDRLRPQDWSTVQVMFAVVDKLPAPRSIEPGTSIQDVFEQCATGAGTGDTGSEGIAYATLPSFVSRSSTSASSQDKGAIDFTLTARTTDDKGTFYDTWRLPLANTIFQTGKPTTMYISNWHLDAKSESPILLDKKSISHHTIDLSFSEQLPQTSSILSIPLTPITLPRTAAGWMGNIIRRVIGPDGESITASLELEKVVPEFFKARGEPARPTTVWALVMPKGKKKVLETRTNRLLNRRIAEAEKGTDVLDLLWQRLWQAKDPWQWNTLVTTAIAEGARLHRVLSGGGGWGKKAGLLSLDPVPVTGEVPIRAEDASSGIDGPGDLSSALTAVAREGEAIQFFIQSEELDGNENIPSLQSASDTGNGGLEFGTVPSTIDSIPGHSQEPATTDPEHVAVFSNSFGALTEGGIILTRHLRPPRDFQAQRPAYTTTIDVPYSRMWSVGLAEEQGSTKHVESSWEHESADFATKRNESGDVQRRRRADVQRKKRARLQEKKEADAQQPNVTKNLFRRVMAPLPSEPERANFESRLASERLHRIEFNVKDLGDEYRFIWHNIKRRMLKDAPVRIRRVTREQPVRRFMANEAPPTPRSAVRDAILAARMQRILDAANFCAFEIYGLHIGLRLQLGRLVMHQTRPDAQQWLATHLIGLRRYNEDLYYRKRGQPKQQIARKLLGLELRSEFQRTVVLPRVPIATPRNQEHKDLKTKPDATGHKKLPIRYRRLRSRSSSGTLPTSRSRRTRRQIIRQHISGNQKALSIRRLPVGPRARLMRSSTPKTNRTPARSTSRSKRDDLVDMASAWLGDEIAAADPVELSPSRPFGSRALPDRHRSNVMGGGVDSAGEVERKPGRVRPFGRQR